MNELSEELSHLREEIINDYLEISDEEKEKVHKCMVEYMDKFLGFINELNK